VATTPFTNLARCRCEALSTLHAVRGYFVIGESRYWWIKKWKSVDHSRENVFSFPNSRVKPVLLYSLQCFGCVVSPATEMYCGSSRSEGLDARYETGRHSCAKNINQPFIRTSTQTLLFRYCVLQLKHSRQVVTTIPHSARWIIEHR
jgi:hypothetical protein